MGTLLQDLKYGLRMLAKNPGFTAVPVLNRALGKGADAVNFSICNGFLFESLLYKDSGRLIVTGKTTLSLNRTLAENFARDAKA
jgi:putative ABC transport system permease protein